MSKKVVRVMKIQFKAGQAKPGPALAGAGIQMPKFCTAFNDQTKDRMGETVPVVLTVYEDKDFSFVLKTAPASEMIKKALGVQKGSSNAGTTTVGTLSADKLKEIGPARPHGTPPAPLWRQPAATSVSAKSSWPPARLSRPRQKRPPGRQRTPPTGSSGSTRFWSRWHGSASRP